MRNNFITGLVLGSVLAGCSRPGVTRPSPLTAPEPSVANSADTIRPASFTALWKNKVPIVPPRIAMLAGLLPTSRIRADGFRRQHPQADGRGVLIAILDSGLDPSLPGLQKTSDGKIKLLDLRDFSGEGRIKLERIHPSGDSVTIGSITLTGFGLVRRFSSGPYYGGTITELKLGRAPAADVNGNGTNTDSLPLIIARGSSGWFLIPDSNGDGDLRNERPVYDYSVAQEYFAYDSESGSDGPLGIVANFSGDSEPELDLFFDNSGHGSHVTGIAAGNDLFGVPGFSGVAPGAQVIAAKIANNARGGISVTGAMLRGMNYAADYAERRNLPLVINLSFGIGNTQEGAAAIDSMVNEFLLKHPGVTFVISAGNDGPGLSTVGFPGSSDLAITVCALFPGVFAEPPRPGVAPLPDVMGWWSARGGEVAKPDVCAPGVAFSNVPRWQTGDEVAAGTSQAAPQIAGAAALLQSAMLERGPPSGGAEIKRALMTSSHPTKDETTIDAGAGVPDLIQALGWLRAAHRTGVPLIRAGKSYTSSVLLHNGFERPSDTVQTFDVEFKDGQPYAALILKTDAPWLTVAPRIEVSGNPISVKVHYDRRQMTEPGLYVGNVSAYPASDTLGGPAFELRNSIVVPLSLDDPVRDRKTVRRGGTARYFVDLPDRAGGGGLNVTTSVADPAQSATLYLFEPGGQPYRGGSSKEFGGQNPASTAIHVPANDIIAGVYEVVVVAPPTGATTFTIDLVVPDVTLEAGLEPWQITLHNRRDSRLDTKITTRIVGASRKMLLEGKGTGPLMTGIEVPEWADEMSVGVTLDPELWNQLTDFGVTLFDESGQQLSQGPLDYPAGSQTLTLEDTRPSRIVLELFPGFAHLKPPEQWTASVVVTFKTSNPIDLSEQVIGPTSPISLEPHGSETVGTSPVLPARSLTRLPGFSQLVEYEAVSAAGSTIIYKMIEE